MESHESQIYHLQGCMKTAKVTDVQWDVLMDLHDEGDLIYCPFCGEDLKDGINRN